MRIYVEDLNNVQVVATEALDALDYATNLSYSNAAPKGHVEARFRLRRSDVYKNFDVKESYGVIVQDGSRVIWQGRIEGINRVTSAGDEFLDCRAVGWAVLLSERQIRKRWIDPDVLLHSTVPTARLNQEDQNLFVIEQRNNEMLVRASAAVDRTINVAHYYQQDYTMWANIDSYGFSFCGRCGEDFEWRIYGSTGTTLESTDSISSGSFQTGTNLTTMTSSSSTLYIRAGVGGTDVYDQNDWIKSYNFTAKARYESDHSAFGSEAYTLSELIEDVVLLVNNYGANISTDFDDIATVATALGAFTTEEYTPGANIIERIANYSDSSDNTYLWYVWDREGTSDSLPKFEFSAWSIADYEYIIDVNDRAVTSASNEKDGRQLYNWVAVKYTDERFRQVTRTPDDNASLKDDTSIANEYQRMAVLNIGKGTATDADNVGERFIEWHKNRKWRGSITVSGDVPTKAGGRVPVEWLRAGQRYYIPQLDQVFFIRTVNVDAENRRATITPDLPPDDINVAIDKLRYETMEAGRKPVYTSAE